MSGNDFEYEKIAPKEPIRIVRGKDVNSYIDATGFCFAQHDVGFDNAIARQNEKKDLENVVDLPSFPFNAAGKGKHAGPFHGLGPKFD